MSQFSGREGIFIIATNCLFANNCLVTYGRILHTKKYKGRLIYIPLSNPCTLRLTRDMVYAIIQIISSEATL